MSRPFYITQTSKCQRPVHGFVVPCCIGTIWAAIVPRSYYDYMNAQGTKWFPPKLQEFYEQKIFRPINPGRLLNGRDRKRRHLRQIGNLWLQANGGGLDPPIILNAPDSRTRQVSSSFTNWKRVVWRLMLVTRSQPTGDWSIDTNPHTGQIAASLEQLSHKQKTYFTFLIEFLSLQRR